MFKDIVLVNEIDAHMVTYLPLFTKLCNWNVLCHLAFPIIILFAKNHFNNHIREIKFKKKKKRQLKNITLSLFGNLFLVV